MINGQTTAWEECEIPRKQVVTELAHALRKFAQQNAIASVDELREAFELTLEDTPDLDDDIRDTYLIIHGES